MVTQTGRFGKVSYGLEMEDKYRILQICTKSIIVIHSAYHISPGAHFGTSQRTKPRGEVGEQEGTAASNTST